MNMATIPVITIDGPSGSGKGTIAQRLARRLAWHFLDSGALYRVLGLAARRQGVSLDDESALARLALEMPLQFIAAEQGDAKIVLAEQEVTDAIRTEACGNDASKVAALPAVRQALLARQHAFRRPPGLVADGRDMGTSVFPDAAVKIFLTASPEVRAERRYKQLKDKGLSVSLSDLLTEIEERDQRDRTRSSSPLRPAADAVVIDTSGLGVEEVLERVTALCGDFL